MTRKTVAYKDLCTQKTKAPWFEIIPFKSSHPTAYKYCRQLGGHLINLEDIPLLGQEPMKLEDDWHWTSLSDQKEEGLFVDAQGRVLGDQWWDVGQPNGERRQNCALYDKSTRKLADKECSYLMRGICRFKQPTKFSLRGVPEVPNSIPMDEIFVRRNRSFMGIYGGKLTVKENDLTCESVSWVLENFKGQVQIESRASSFSPIGVQEWELSNTSIRFNLSLDVCSEDQFNCLDGTCVAFTERCDYVKHCQDGSDEFDCDRVLPPPSYIKTKIPVNAGHTMHLNLSTMEVTVLETLDTQSIMTLQILLKTEWRDSMLSFLNLQEGVLNHLSKQEYRDGNL